MQPNYLKLSEQYGSFLAALGGVSIAVLTLVLSFGKNTTGQKYRTALISTLMVATLASFTGAHLMAETASLGIGTGEPPPGVGERLFFIASINIYLATILLILMMVLLAAEYGEQHPAVSLISAVAFGFVILAALGWMLLSLTSRVSDPLPVWAVLVLAVGIGLWFALALWLLDPGLIRLSYTIIILCTALSLLYFACTYDDNRQAHARDKWAFGIAIIVSGFSLLAIGLRTLKDEIKDYFNHKRRRERTTEEKTARKTARKKTRQRAASKPERKAPSP